MSELYTLLRAAIDADETARKIQLTRDLVKAWRDGNLSRWDDAPVAPIGTPGRPLRPTLVAPRELVQRKLTTEEGRAALVHAIAHIEFNAINLALDAAYRFRDLPDSYYADWLRVAVEEASHFEMLNRRLGELGYTYGDFPAHNGLWEMAEETAHDHMVRMALVPRVLEARGLDVTPGMLERLQRVGDDKTVAILEIILEEEVAHVAIGSYWFKYACEKRGLVPEPTFRELLDRYMRGRLKGPFNYSARQAAGFSEEELKALEQFG
ncbi:hypothetical protein CAI21_02570 [Alkalilimnicola ehrlichii]|uniref:DUF455 domain-containing protein n=1 Tax=Alkalilimnicola ehrlichii TaxID=351052 RepID=A0A3E0X2L4_9GAMM|nr:ferritin-like domain-containing protein [Alkalilimnicola ehrlichii]RFA30883.1 hypothetical protein CAI21_02570 [Alkalilimnicola ehrlichii]RFA38833.1 hypothetical protein CAL65_02715 [Alkalilimnicola ehrlichii]